MMKPKDAITALVILFALAASMFFYKGIACAHDDTLEGPAIKDARAALEKRDVTPVLKWVAEDYEKQVREDFDRTLTARKRHPKTKDQTDMDFFQAVLKAHRESIGAGPATALGEYIPQISLEVDRALDEDDSHNLELMIIDNISRTLRDRFARFSQRKARMNDSVADGRAYAEAYVEFVHYVERLYNVSIGDRLISRAKMPMPVNDTSSGMPQLQQEKR
jgi:hypothetical protein